MSANTFIVRVLNECGSLLTATIDRYPKAWERLTVEVTPGFPGKTPGSGDPGSGRGPMLLERSTDPDTDIRKSTDPAEGTIVERLALSPSEQSVLDELEQLGAGPQRIAVYTTQLLRSIGIPSSTPKIPPPAGPPMEPLLATAHCVSGLRWCRDFILAVVDRPHHVERCLVGRVQNVHRPVVDLHRLTVRWGYDPKKGESADDPTLLATDLTEMWCRSCLRAGSRYPRYVGDLCQWCWRFHQEQGFLPPPEIIDARARGQRITEQMVEPHRRRHRERRKSRSRKR